MKRNVNQQHVRVTYSIETLGIDNESEKGKKIFSPRNVCLRFNQTGIKLSLTNTIIIIHIYKLRGIFIASILILIVVLSISNFRMASRVLRINCSNCERVTLIQRS